MTEHYKRFKDHSESAIKQFELKEMIKILDRISLDLKKLTEESHLMLCELNLECSRPEETIFLKGEEKLVAKKKLEE